MKERRYITKKLIGLLEDEEVKSLLLKSLRQAKDINNDPLTNPCQTIEELYDFIDYASTCMPWNIIKNKKFNTLFEAIDQSINYIWFIFGQQLEELKDKGYYLPTLEYHEPIASWLKEYSKDWGNYLSTKESWNDEYFKLQFSDNNFGMNEGWYGKDNIWHTYNEFFSRKLIDTNYRPIGKAPLVSPADAKIEGIWQIKEDGYINDNVKIKSHKFYTINDLLGNKEKYEDLFNGGTLTHAFLNVNDYHRYHFPIDGTIIDMYKIEGFNAVGGFVYYDIETKSYICDCSDTSWQARETRDCIILDTEYGKVAILPVGMSQVCSCNFEEHLKIGDKVKKGDPLGYFLFGGSDIAIVFQKHIKVTLLKDSNEHILMGQDYANLEIIK